MKKLIPIISTIIFTIVISISFLTACSTDNSQNGKDSKHEALNSNDGKLKIVATIFPEYDWTRNIIAGTENTVITLMAKNGADMHSYQPSAKDLVTISECDVFIYTGGESDKWVSDALDQATKQREGKKIRAIDLMKILGDKARAEELKEGMQSGRGEADPEETEYDEHVWLSLRNAQIFTESIADALKKADPENADKYSDNAAAYTKKLKDLDSRYIKTIKDAKANTLIFADRFPFRYLTADYGLDYYAAFAGCSSESAASFETMTFLAKKADELDIKDILTIEGSDRKIAKAVTAITKNNDEKILTMDSMQTKTKGSYLAIMEKNLKVLGKALSNR